MTPNKVSVHQAVRVLNEALSLDRVAVESLFSYRVSVNKELAEHPTIQVLDSYLGLNVSVLGLLNGIFGVDEKNWGFIAMEVDDKDHRRILRFVVREPQSP